MKYVTALVISGIGAAALAQAPPAPSPVKRAIDERRAIFTLIGSNFRPVGEVLQGRANLDSSEMRKRAARVAFLAGLSSEAFSDVSNAGAPSTRAKAEIWTNRADFDARLAEFVKHTQALARATANEHTTAEEFKAAAGAVAQDCKDCHDKFREK